MKRSQILTAVGLVVAAFALRYVVAGRAIWFDERFTLLNTGSVGAAVDYCVKGFHPPLYFTLVALWRGVFPSTEFSLRCLSLVFGMLSLGGIFLAGRAVGGRGRLWLLSQ